HRRCGTVRDVLLVGKPRLAEMDLIIDGARQQMLALRIELLHPFRIADPFRGHTLDKAIANQHVRWYYPAFIHHLDITEQPAVHGPIAVFAPRLIVVRIISTPRKAS